MKKGYKALSIIVFLGLFLVAFISGNAYASIKFAESGPGRYSVIFESPLDGYEWVTSSFNQPRNVSGSNPHQGVDLRANTGEDVYAIWYGEIVDTGTTSGGSKWMKIQLDWNQNGNLDNLYVTYHHLNSYVMSKGQKVSPTDVVAISGSSGTSVSHLHFEINTNFNHSEGTYFVNIPTFPYYEYIGSNKWNNGYDLDFIKDVSWWNGRTLAFYCYAHDENGKHPTDQGDVVIWHKPSTSQTWQGPVTANKSEDLFFYDFSSLYSSGTEVHMIISAQRTYPNGGAPSYNRAFSPPKYYQPDLNPNNWLYPYYWAATLNY